MNNYSVEKKMRGRESPTDLHLERSEGPGWVSSQVVSVDIVKGVSRGLGFTKGRSGYVERGRKAWRLRGSQHTGRKAWAMCGGMFTELSASAFLLPGAQG